MYKRTNLSGVYRIRNTLNDKVYIGSTNNFMARFRGHKTSFKRNISENKYLQELYNKYGISCFKFEILEYCRVEKLKEVEQKYINQTLELYNICKNSRSPSGVKRSDEYKIKMSKTKSKQVYQYNKSMNLINVYPSVKLASIITKINDGNISMCCIGKRKSAGNYIWNYQGSELSR